MSNENPTENSREVFDENEAGIAQKKQEITDAVAAGEYDKVAELAQEAKGMETAKAEMKEDAHGEALEMNAGIDEAKAAEEKAQRELALAEQAKQDAENSQKEAAALLEKLKGGNTEKVEEVQEKKEDISSEEFGEELRAAETELEKINAEWDRARREQSSLWDNAVKRFNATDLPKVLEATGNGGNEAGIGFYNILEDPKGEFATWVTDKINEMLDENNAGVFEKMKIRNQLRNYIKETSEDSKLYPTSKEIDQLLEERTKCERQLRSIKTNAGKANED